MKELLMKCLERALEDVVEKEIEKRIRDGIETEMFDQAIEDATGGDIDSLETLKNDWSDYSDAVEELETAKEALNDIFGIARENK